MLPLLRPLLVLVGLTDVAWGQEAFSRYGGEPAIRNWSGAYVGGHLSGAMGETFKGTLPHGYSGGQDRFLTTNAGLLLGYNVVIPGNVFVGIEADATFPNFFEGDDTLKAQARGAGYTTEKIDHVATLRGRYGIVAGNWLMYGTAGVAWGQGRLNDSAGALGEGIAARHQRFGWAAGGGLEYALGGGWNSRVEYLYSHLGSDTARIPTGSIATTSLDLHSIRAGLVYKLGDVGAESTGVPKSEGASGRGTMWNVHGQSTLVVQGYPSFNSPYEGSSSLKGSSQIRNTASASAFLGVRIGPNTELYINPEIYQGFGLSDVRGLAGFPNGEAQKSSFPIPRSNIARLFVRHTFGFGGEQEEFEDGPNQLAGKADVSRLTVTAGKLAAKDFFDVNTYANDPRVGFLNWNMYGGGSYDWTMDKLSWTWGAVAELNQKNWAFRAGYFLVPTTSNANTFDPAAPERGEYAAELELRHSIAGMPGKVRLFGWANNALMGSYAESVRFAQVANDLPDLATTRRGRTNLGVVAGIEQAITDDIGVFSRASWSPGKAEVIGWTDVHDSVSLGAVIKGTSWGRPADRFGIGAVNQGLSNEGRQYFAAGGVGILIGDGALSYRREQVIETYYAYSLGKASTISADYQFIVNPAYNSDRGPVNVFAMRLHSEF